MLALALVLGTSNAEAAITRDAVSQNVCTSTSCSTTHLVGAANSQAILSVHMFGFSSVPSVTAASIGGTPATFIGRVVNPSCAGGQCVVEQWGLFNPPTGSQTASVTISFSGQIVLGVVTELGVDSTTPLGTPVSLTGTGTAPSVTATTAVGDVLVGAVSIANAGGSPSPSGGGSSFYSTFDNGGSFHAAGSDQASLGTSTLYGWTYPTSQAFAMLAVPLKAAGSGGGGGGFSTERLVWTDLSAGLAQETSTRVYWKHSSQPTYQILATLVPDSTSYTVSYTTQTDRCYVVDQINSAGTSPLSNELCSTITAPGPIRPTLTPASLAGGLSDY